MRWPLATKIFRLIHRWSSKVNKQITIIIGLDRNRSEKEGLTAMCISKYFKYLNQRTPKLDKKIISKDNK